MTDLLRGIGVNRKGTGAGGLLRGRWCSQEWIACGGIIADPDGDIGPGRGDRCDGCAGYRDGSETGARATPAAQTAGTIHDLIGYRFAGGGSDPDRTRETAVEHGCVRGPSVVRMRGCGNDGKDTVACGQQTADDSAPCVHGSPLHDARIIVTSAECRQPGSGRGR